MHTISRTTGSRVPLAMLHAPSWPPTGFSRGVRRAYAAPSFAEARLEASSGQSLQITIHVH